MGLRPVWAALSTSGIANFPLLPGIEGLHLLAESDANGASWEAIAICGRRWHGASCDVFIVTDLNDELREIGCEN
jgi:putative DNA primase/helicase